MRQLFSYPSHFFVNWLYGVSLRNGLINIIYNVIYTFFKKVQRSFCAPNMIVRKIILKCLCRPRESWLQVDLQISLPVLRGICDSSVKKEGEIIEANSVPNSLTEYLE